jgi:hypothetical protein
MLSANAARIETRRPSLGPVHVAMFEMCMATSTAIMTAKFKEPLHPAWQCYTTYVMDRLVEGFSKHIVSPSAVITSVRVVRTHPYLGLHHLPIPSLIDYGEKNVVSTG